MEVVMLINHAEPLTIRKVVLFHFGLGIAETLTYVILCSQSMVLSFCCSQPFSIVTEPAPKLFGFIRHDSKRILVVALIVVDSNSRKCFCVDHIVEFDDCD